MVLQAIDWAFVFAFFLFSLIIGLAVSKRAGRSASEFFLSGRNMPWWLLGVSMVATTFSTDTPNLVTLFSVIFAAAAALAFADLQPEDILATLDELGFRCDGRFLALNSYENRVYQIGIEDGPPVVTKFYRPGRWSDDAILEEHAFAADLAAQDIPVVPPLEHKKTTLHHAGHHRVAVYPCYGGRSPELDDFELQKQLGRLVARIHLEPCKHLGISVDRLAELLPAGGGARRQLRGVASVPLGDVASRPAICYPEGGPAAAPPPPVGPSQPTSPSTSR